MNDNVGKQAEQKIREWLDKPEDIHSCLIRGVT